LSRSVPLAAACIALVGCDQIKDPCFTPPSIVDDVRILAIRADPPEARFDPSTNVADPVTLSALIVRPQLEVRSASVTWDLCAPSEDTPGCPPGSTVLADPEWGPGKSVRVQPSMIAVRAGRDGKPLEEIPASNLAIKMSEAHTTAIRPVLADGSLEEYDSIDLAGNPIHLRERVTYSFYTDSSVALGRGLVLKHGAIPVVIYRGLDDFEADEPDPGTPDTPQGLFDAVPVHAGGNTGSIWIVARDSRGGISWLSIPYVAVEERPECRGPPPHGACPELQFGCQ
jgi:hypothetical protein